MRSRKTAQTVALVGAVAVFLASLVVLRRPTYVPFLVGAFAYVALLLALWPNRRRQAPTALPDGVKRADFEFAIERLHAGAAKLRAAIAEAPLADGPLFNRMADLLDTIREHHVSNPSHVTTTRIFMRHTLGRIIETVGEYVELAQRAGSNHADRLAEVSRQFEDFVPVLEKIDQACLDNDLTALEINVEVLNDQLDRKR